jgi:SET domain-containing protein
MMLVRCYLAPSAIEGLGVFTHEPIAKGQTMWRFDREFDRVIPVAAIREAPEHVREFMERYTYPLYTDRENYVVLDADEGRFMNHSDEPNCVFPADGEVGWAARDIAAGEELTCDYALFCLHGVEFQPSRHAVGAAVEGKAA